MKKIMFNDKYGLTIAVLNGNKTMTRRAITDKNAIYTLDEQEFMGQMAVDYSFSDRYSRYKLGEEVAVAMSYKDAGYEWKDTVGYTDYGQNMFSPLLAINSSGWGNKMFVKADLMPLGIRITDIKVERLQDISEEDCLKEGTIEEELDYKSADGHKHDFKYYGFDGIASVFVSDSPRAAFAELIDKETKTQENDNGNSDNTGNIHSRMRGGLRDKPVRHNETGRRLPVHSRGHSRVARMLPVLMDSGRGVHIL